MPASEAQTINRTDSRHWASCIAREQDVVVLPTPPLPPREYEIAEGQADYPRIVSHETNRRRSTLKSSGRGCSVRLVGGQRFRQP